MALIKCPECGKEVSDTCEQCIHCGYKLKKDVKEETNPIIEQKKVVEQPRQRRGLPSWAVALIVLGAIPIAIAILAPIFYIIWYLKG